MQIEQRKRKLSESYCGDLKIDLNKNKPQPRLDACMLPTLKAFSQKPKKTQKLIERVGMARLWQPETQIDC